MGDPSQSGERTSTTNDQSDSHLHPIIFCGVAQGLISETLSPGWENALSRRELERWTVLDGRTVCLMTERERRAGVPILTDNATDYFLSTLKDKEAVFARSTRHRAHEILTTATVVERGLCDTLEGGRSEQTESTISEKAI